MQTNWFAGSVTLVLFRYPGLMNDPRGNPNQPKHSCDATPASRHPQHGTRTPTCSV